MTTFEFRTIIRRIGLELAFRRQFELCPEEVLRAFATLTDEERGALLGYRAGWIRDHHVEPCPQCGCLAVVSSQHGAVIRCERCASAARPHVLV